MNLYPYQHEGARFLAERPRAYLADGMGLGKSAQAITAARKAGARQSLVVAPASALPNWEREWEKWGGPGVVEVVSYGVFSRRVPKVTPPDTVILDEAHYIKSPSAARTRNVVKTVRSAERVWLLSGTPMPNNPGELWSPVKAFWPDLAAVYGLKTAAQWTDYFCKTRPTPYGLKPYGVRNGRELRAMVAKFMLRRKAEDVGLELPPLRVHLHRLPYQELPDGVNTGEEEEYTSTARRLLGSAKAGPIADLIVEEIHDKAYRSIVVLYYHRGTRDLLLGRFRDAGISVVGFGGETPGAERQRAIDAFQAGRAQVFLAQQSAAGVAINLTAASEIALVEPAWSPDDNGQAIKRIHRIGQDQPCRARLFAVSGTLDEAIMGTIANKVSMQQEVFGAHA